MDALNAVKSAVLVDEPEKSVPVAAVTASVPVGAAYMEFSAEKSALVPVMPSPATAPVAAAPVNDFLVKLRAKLQEPGSIIDKFENSLSSLSMIPDLGMRASAAISVLTASAGITAQQLKAAYAARIGALDKEVNTFRQVVASQSETDIGVRQGRLQQITRDIEAKAKEIEALTAQRESPSRSWATEQLRRWRR